MDAYAAEVIAVLDHLDIEQAAVGGISLGANVSLHVAVLHPDRVQALVLEMPVLEWAVPAAALLFTPLLLTMHYASRPAGLFSRLVDRLPSTPNEALNSVIGMAAKPPEVVKAVLHGILTGPVAPTVEQRAGMAAPTLVLAHTRDLIHPFSDAKALVNLVPDGTLLPTRSMLELRVRPDRLTGEIADFLDRAWVATGS
jgi:pimeloyl-ACP methyl ester carboxylesterase